MAPFRELTIQELQMGLEEFFIGETSQDIIPYKSIIGQKTAEEAIELGLKMDKKSYNIFISGRSGTGKTGYILKKIEDHAKTLPAPLDWCYVNNFKDENTPMAISLETGTAPILKGEVEKVIYSLLKEVPLFFHSSKYDMEKNTIIDKYEKRGLLLTEELQEIALEQGFHVKETPAGEFVFVPLLQGEEMEREQYDALPLEEKKGLNKAVGKLKNLALEIAKELSLLQKNLEEELRQLDQEIAKKLVTPKIQRVLEKFGKQEKIKTYLEDLQEDLLKHIRAFLGTEKAEERQKIANEWFLRRYEVNVLVSHDKAKGAPVVFADAVDSGSLFGKVEYENTMGNLTTDFTLLRPGSLHLANGGFLLVKASKLLRNPRAWEHFKKCIHLETLFLENAMSSLERVPIITLSPESIPLKVKVILLGSNFLYTLLLHQDEEFEKLFKIKAEFDEEIEKEEENVKKITGYIAYYLEKENMLPMKKEAMQEMLRYASRLAGNRNYFSASLHQLLPVVELAEYYAKQQENSFIEGSHVKEALEKKEQMHGLLRKKILEGYKQKKFIVNLGRSEIGQINGLSILQYGDCTVGQQHRITVTVHAGKKGVISIEREAGMSGNLHEKGVLILSGYLGELLGQEHKIAFHANIVFEQLYSGIDGDSASAAELIALLSRLSEVPLKQSLAITGSIDQKGNIQPIGGVNEKIEGYFDICALFGLDGTHGVVIPESNVEDLVLQDRVLEAVEQGLFHIYAVSRIEEALEVFCEDPFRKKVEGKVMEAIQEKMIEKLKRYESVLKEA